MCSDDLQAHSILTTSTGTRMSLIMDETGYGPKEKEDGLGFRLGLGFWVVVVPRVELDRENGTRKSRRGSEFASACRGDLNCGEADPCDATADPPRRVHQLRVGWRWQSWLDPRLPLRPCNSRGFHDPGAHRRS